MTYSCMAAELGAELFSSKISVILYSESICHTGDLQGFEMQIGTGPLPAF